MLTSLTLPSGTQAKRMEDYVVLIVPLTTELNCCRIHT